MFILTSYFQVSNFPILLQINMLFILSRFEKGRSNAHTHTHTHVQDEVDEDEEADEQPSGSSKLLFGDRVKDVPAPLHPEQRSRTARRADASLVVPRDVGSTEDLSEAGQHGTDMNRPTSRTTQWTQCFNMFLFRYLAHHPADPLGDLDPGLKAGGSESLYFNLSY